MIINKQNLKTVKEEEWNLFKSYSQTIQNKNWNNRKHNKQFFKLNIYSIKNNKINFFNNFHSI